MSQSVPDADEMGSVEVSGNSQYVNLAVDDGYVTAQVELTPSAALKLANELMMSAIRIQGGLNVQPVANGCKYVRKDGLMGWERRNGRWFTAAPDGRPQGSPCPYMDDLTIASLIADGTNTNWELIQPEAT